MDDASKAAETREERLRIDNHLLKRSNLRLKGDLAIEKKKMERMLRDNTTLREGMSDQQVGSRFILYILFLLYTLYSALFDTEKFSMETNDKSLRLFIYDWQESIRKLRQELEERDTVMSENYNTIQHLR